MATKNLIFSLLLFSISIYSQKQQYLSIGMNNEIHYNDKMRIGYGLSFENQFSKHSGFEIGLNYRNKIISYFLYDPNFMSNEQQYILREDYISIPILYRFYSKVANVSSGITFDYYIGWKNKSPNSTNYILTNHSPIPKLFLGWAFKISKPINIASKLIFEPEIQFNPIFRYYDFYYGLSMKLKYQL
jgi:hypothetical protein